MDIYELHEDKLDHLIGEAASLDIGSEEASVAMTNLDKFSKIQLPERLPTPDPTPTTRWGRFKVGAAAALDNETTRAMIKAGGAFASVGLVVYSTIHRDHVVERTALQQANQHPS